MAAVAEALAADSAAVDSAAVAEEEDNLFSRVKERFFCSAFYKTLVVFLRYRSAKNRL